MASIIRTARRAAAALCALSAGSLVAAEGAAAPHDHDHDHGHGHRHGHDRDLWQRDLGGDAKLRLIDLSAIVQVAAGATDADDEHAFEATQTGNHDPRRDGFTFQQLELSLYGAVDPYFAAEAHVLVTENDGLELEEAFAVTTGLPHGLEVEAGYMLTEFGRYNPVHTHEYAFIDQPLVIGSLLGPEGMRDVGVRGAWLLPTDWFSELHLTVQNGDDDTMISFLGEGHSHDEAEGEEGHGGGRFEVEGLEDLLYAGRWVNGFELSDDLEVQLGVSAAYGPNLFHDHTLLLGADVVAKWYNPGAPAGAGVLSWVTEVIWREVGTEEDESASNWGLVNSVTYGFVPRWQLGLRIDYVDLEEEAGHEEEGGEEEEHHAGELLRLSPLIAFTPSEFSKLRLQYNFSSPDEGDDIHSAWLGLEVLIGAHPAHGF